MSTARGGTQLTGRRAGRQGRKARDSSRVCLLTLRDCSDVSPQERDALCVRFHFKTFFIEVVANNFNTL